MSEQVADNERWKTDGDCRYCRRNNYCKKVCVAADGLRRQLLKESIERVLAKRRSQNENTSEI